MSEQNEAPVIEPGTPAKAKPAGGTPPRDPMVIAAARMTVAIERLADAHERIAESLDALRAIAMGEREESAAMPTQDGQPARDPVDVESLLSAMDDR